MPRKTLSTAALCIALTSNSAIAEAHILYCTVEHTVGMILEDETWSPAYDDASSGIRYTIKFSDDFSTVKGVGGTNTEYLCGLGFPNKFPNVVTCINSLVATMAFSYSRETGNFILTMTSPAGWLNMDTKPPENEILSDSLIFGKCQDF